MWWFLKCVYDGTGGESDVKGMRWKKSSKMMFLRFFSFLNSLFVDSRGSSLMMNYSTMTWLCIHHILSIISTDILLYTNTIINQNYPWNVIIVKIHSPKQNKQSRIRLQSTQKGKLYIEKHSSLIAMVHIKTHIIEQKERQIHYFL